MGEGWAPGRLEKCPKFDRIVILMASIIFFLIMSFDKLGLSCAKLSSCWG